MHVTTAGELRYPWLLPIADLCTQRQPALACVASVSSRVMREIWSGNIFLVSFQFSRRTRVEPLATQANQPWWSYIFQNTWQLTRVYNEKMMWYRAIADSFLVILGDFGCDFDHLSMRSRYRARFQALLRTRIARARLGTRLKPWEDRGQNEGKRTGGVGKRREIPFWEWISLVCTPDILSLWLIRTFYSGTRPVLSKEVVL